MNTAWILLLLMMYTTFNENAGKEVKWIIPVLTPEDNVCIKRALELGFQDINGTRLKSATPGTYYTLSPEFHTAGRNYAKLVELVNEIHAFATKNKRLPEEMVKRLTIGPPYSDQITLYSEFLQVLPNIQVGYNAIPEPHAGNIRLRFQTPPSISGLFHTSRVFMLNMSWTHAILVYDFSNSRYRHSVNNLEEILQEKDATNETIQVVYKARVRSELTNTNMDTFKRLPHLDARIAFLLVGVAGARQIFCEAYHLKLQKSGFVWIMLEKLPKGWMTEKYDIIDDATGKRKREIDCTPDQLFSVAKNIIYIVRGGVRRDNAILVNGHTASDFQSRLKKIVDGKEFDECIDDAAYAYDSVWLSVKVLETAMGYSRFEKQFTYIRGTGLYPDLSVLTYPAIKFEGVTGALSFEHDSTFLRNTRAGSQWIYSVRDAGNPVWLGSYETKNKELFLVDNAVDILFGAPVIPSDRAKYIYTEYKFPEGYIIAIWTLACIGIFVTLALSCLISVCRRSNMGEKVGQKGLECMDIVMVVGFLVCFVSLICYGLDTRFLSRADYKNGCYGFLTTLTIGFSLTFGTLFAKTWYKYKLYNAPSAEKEVRLDRFITFQKYFSVWE